MSFFFFFFWASLCAKVLLCISLKLMEAHSGCTVLCGVIAAAVLCESSHILTAVY